MVCPACQARRTMLTILNQKTGNETQQENTELIVQEVQGYIKETAALSEHLRSETEAVEKWIQGEESALTQRTAGILQAERERADSDIRTREETVIQQLSNEMNGEIERMNQAMEPLKAKRFEKVLAHREYLLISVILYAVFAGLLFFFKSRFSALPFASSAPDSTPGTIALDLLLFIPLYVLASVLFIILYRGFLNGFYGFRKRKIKINNDIMTNKWKNIEEIRQYYNEQISYVQRSPEEAPDCLVEDEVADLYEYKRQRNEAIGLNSARTEKMLRDNMEKNRRNATEKVQALRMKWTESVLEAAGNYVVLFERQFHSPRRDKGPVYWLFFRFCGPEGAIAAAPRGIGNLRILRQLTVDVTEEYLFAEVKDAQGNELIKNEELQYYHFTNANERILSDPAERMGYSAALMACTVFEARMDIERARYDEHFELKIVRDADENGFTIEYEGTNYT